MQCILYFFKNFIMIEYIYFSQQIIPSKFRLIRKAVISFVLNESEA